MREGAAPSLPPNNLLDLCSSAWSQLENPLLPASGEIYGINVWDKRGQMDPVEQPLCATHFFWIPGLGSQAFLQNLIFW